MVSNSDLKQKEKLFDEYFSERKKIEEALSSLKESVLSIQEGEDGNSPYWNGKNAYTVVSKALSFIDKGYAILDYMGQLDDSIKK